MQYKQIKSNRKIVNPEKQSSLKILFLAPQPFYQERSPPIANKGLPQEAIHDRNYPTDFK